MPRDSFAISLPAADKDFRAPQRLMTPEALEFVRLTSVQTVKGWEDRAQLPEFRHVPTLA